MNNPHGKTYDPGRQADGKDWPRKYDGWTITELQAELKSRGLWLSQQEHEEDADYENEMRDLLRMKDRIKEALS